MSKVAITGNASGTGTFTIASPNSNTDRTLNLPDNSGTVITTGSTFAGTGPAFSAYLSSNQTVSAAVFTKVLLNTESFDTNSNFASSRFTPTVAGYYQINTVSRVPSATSSLVAVYKNGSIWARGNYPSGDSFNSVASTLVYCDGSTDYIEMYVYTSGTTISGIASETMMSGFLARSA